MYAKFVPRTGFVKVKATKYMVAFFVIRATKKGHSK